VVSIPYSEFTCCGSPNQNIFLSVFAQQNPNDNLGFFCPKIMFITSTSHPLVSGSMSSATFACSEKDLFGDCIVKVVGAGIHLSPQMLTVSPLLILHSIPSFNSSQADEILLHANNGLLHRVASIKDPCG